VYQNDRPYNGHGAAIVAAYRAVKGESQEMLLDGPRTMSPAGQGRPRARSMMGQRPPPTSRRPALAGAGFVIDLMAPGRVVLGGWVGGVILLVFAFGLLAAYRRGLHETRQPIAR
jgi:hypothetical protein